VMGSATLRESLSEDAIFNWKDEGWLRGGLSDHGR
jgi:hypothetical protein